jgi:6-phosphogluconolactonase
MSRIILNPDTALLYERAFTIFKTKADNILMKKNTIIMGIPGGRSINGLYSEFKNRYSEVQWNRIHIFMADERIVPPDSQYSNFRLAKESFLDYLLVKNLISKNQVHPFKEYKNKPDYGCGRYVDEFRKFGGIFDILILGAGEDGHTAALFPNHNSFYDDSEYFTVMNNSPKFPPVRITVSRKLLVKSGTVLLFYTGKGKKNAFKNFSDKSIKTENCPSKLVNEVADSYIFTDINYQS